MAYEKVMWDVKGTKYNPSGFALLTRTFNKVVVATIAFTGVQQATKYVLAKIQGPSNDDDDEDSDNNGGPPKDGSVPLELS